MAWTARRSHRCRSRPYGDIPYTVRYSVQGLVKNWHTVKLAAAHRGFATRGRLPETLLTGQNGFRAFAARLRSARARDEPDEAEAGWRARHLERLALLLWIVVIWGAFGLSVYALAVEARTRFEGLLVLPRK